MTGHAAGPGEMLFRFVRHWARRANQISSPVFADRGRDVMITEAVLAASKRGDPTVADVAAELGIDQSGASRMIQEAAKRMLLETRPSRADGRRRTVHITPTGNSMLTDAHRWQEDTFETLTTDWTETERREFARSLSRLLTRHASTDHPSGDRPDRTTA